MSRLARNTCLEAKREPYGNAGGDQADSFGRDHPIAPLIRASSELHVRSARAGSFFRAREPLLSQACRRPRHPWQNDARRATEIVNQAYPGLLDRAFRSGEAFIGRKMRWLLQKRP